MRTILSIVLLSACVANPSTTPGTPAPVCVAGRIPTTGGELALDGVSVEFPAGALAVDTDLELCLDEPAPAGLTPRSVVARVSPDVELLVPATVTLPFDGSDAALFTPDPAWTAARQLRATLDEAEAHGPTWRTGVFLVAEDLRAADPYLGVPIGDLLFVVDNSCSMTDEQRRLGREMGDVVAELTALELDFHAGVVTTDWLDDGLLAKEAEVQWVEPSTPDAAAVFEAMAARGTKGSFPEQGSWGAHRALANPANAGFVRDEAQLAVIIVSDEPDFTRNSQLVLGDWIDELLTFKDDPAWVRQHAVIAPVGGQYRHVADETGGMVADITDPQWAGFVDDMLAGMADFARMSVPGAEATTVELWVLPLDGSEPWRFTDCGYDEVSGTVWIGGTGLPDGELLLLWAPAAP